jgi:chromosome segregation ATPase
MENRDQYVEGLKNKLDEWNEQIGKLQEQMESSTGEAKARYASQLEDMQAHADDAQNRMQELVQSSAADWEKMRGNFDSAWSNIASGFGRAWSRFH